MSKIFRLIDCAHLLRNRAVLTAPAAVFVLLTIEFTDEFTFGLREAAWPQLRDDLTLTYVQIGLIFALPGFTSAVVEIAIGVLADIGHRRKLIILGGVLFGVALLVTAGFPSFAVLLLATVVLYPASGAFVSLSQASLMDRDPTRREQNMARWTFAGSVGVVLGSLAVAGGALVGVDWRVLFAAAGTLAVVITAVVARIGLPEVGASAERERESFRAAFIASVRLIRRRRVLRWLGLLELADLMYAVLIGFLALYFVDVVDASPTQAALAVTVWTVVGLLGDFAVIPLLERVPGISYLRVSALLTTLVFPAFLIVPGIGPKLILLGLLGFLNAGWYSILQARLYSELPGRSGSVVAVTAVASVVGSTMPLAIGALAGAIGLQAALWFLLASPIVLLVGLPRGKESGSVITDESVQE